MLQRMLLCVSMLGVFACTRSDAAPRVVPRPAAVGESPIARVLHLSGATTVTPKAGAPFPAAVDHDLVPSDTLEPAVGGFVIIGLRNGHVVRLDDTGALAVGDILLVSADATDVPVAIQLAQLLDDGERTAGVEKAVSERAAAWLQMRRAGESTRSAEAAAVSPSAGAPGLAMPPPPSAKVAGRAQGEKKENRQGPARRDASPLDDAASIEPGVTASSGPTPKTASPLAAAPFLGGDVRGCLLDTAAATALDPMKVVLWLEVKQGRVVRVRFGGALPVSPCAAALTRKPVAAADGWLVVVVGPTP